MRQIIQLARHQCKAGNGTHHQSKPDLSVWVQQLAERLVEIREFTSSDKLFQPETDIGKYVPLPCRVLISADDRRWVCFKYMIEMINSETR
jgi:hypothetical protein